MDKIKDFLERVGSTFLEVEIGLGALDVISGGINLSTLHVLYAGLGGAIVATIKVLIAQQVSKRNSGAAVDVTKK